MVELKQLILQRPSWLEQSAQKETIILDTRVALSRNLERHPFPAKASLLEKQQVFAAITKAVEEKNILGETFLKLNLQEISDISKTLLFERDFVNLEMVQSVGDRGVLASYDGPALTINGSNHLTLFHTSHNKSPFEAWQLLDSIDTELGKELTYAYDDEQGFLLSKSTESGTGLSVTSTLHLPGLLLTGTLDQILSGVSQMGLTAEGKFRNSGDAWGSLFSITAGAYAGEREEEIIEKHEAALEEIEKHELEARTLLFKEAPIEMEDKVWRSYGILQHSRILSVPQLLNLTSALRLGIERGVIDSLLSMDNLNGLISSALQGSVALLMEEDPVESDDMEIERAEIVRTLLQ